jgi:hypothetical protein
MAFPACFLLMTCTAAVPVPASIAHHAGCFRSFLQEAGIRTSQALQLQPEQPQQQQQQAANSKRAGQKLPDTELALQVTLEVRNSLPV